MSTNNKTTENDDDNGNSKINENPTTGSVCLSANPGHGTIVVSRLSVVYGTGLRLSQTERKYAHCGYKQLFIYSIYTFRCGRDVSPINSLPSAASFYRQSKIRALSAKDD